MLVGCCKLLVIHLESAEDDSGGALDDLKAFRQQRGVAFVKLDVVARCCAHLQTHGLTHDEGHGLGFGFAHGGGGDGAALGLMEKLVRLCSAKHKRTYVVFAVMLRSGCEGASSLGLLILDTT